MSVIHSAISIPDTKLAKEATEILREQSTELLYNHSIRVYLFAAEQGRQAKLHFDPELLYVSAAFHDLGLIKKYSSDTEWFEVDGANAVRQFLVAHSVPEEQVQTAWEAIALHTTPGAFTGQKSPPARASALPSTSAISRAASCTCASQAFQYW